MMKERMIAVYRHGAEVRALTISRSRYMAAIRPWFGELAIWNGKNRAATARCLEPSAILLVRALWLKQEPCRLLNASCGVRCDPSFLGNFLTWCPNSKRCSRRLRPHLLRSTSSCNINRQTPPSVSGGGRGRGLKLQSADTSSG
eukprot:6972886-Prymnesium_polylepis.1